MSERGSFVTEYIYCEDCFKAVEKIMCDYAQYIFGNPNLPIIAGKVKGSYAGEEVLTMEMDIVPEIKKVICHKVRIAVLGDTDEKIFKIKPKRINK